MAQITIFGLPGTGTTTLGKQLAEKLGYSFISSGNIFRAKANELGLSLYEFDALCSRDDSYDKALDAEIEKIGNSQNNFVFESRLAWHFIPTSFKVKIVCDDTLRITRVAQRDSMSLAEAEEKTRAREKAGPLRYQKYYGITEFAPDKAFDLILDSTSTTTEQLIEEILQKTSKFVA